MARIKMPATRSKAKELTFEEAFHIFLTNSAARGPAKKIPDGSHLFSRQFSPL